MSASAVAGHEQPAGASGSRGPGSTVRLLLKELSAFGVVGVACFFLDVGLFQFLYSSLETGAVTAKLTSSVVSMTAAYFAHRSWSFSHRSRSNPRGEYLLFMVINGGTLALSLAVVALVRYPLHQTGSVVLQTANVGTIVLSTALRYLGYRAWVFPALPATSDPDAAA